MQLDIDDDDDEEDDPEVEQGKFLADFSAFMLDNNNNDNSISNNFNASLTNRNDDASFFSQHTTEQVSVYSEKEISAHIGELPSKSVANKGKNSHVCDAAASPTKKKSWRGGRTKSDNSALKKRVGELSTHSRSREVSTHSRSSINSSRSKEMSTHSRSSLGSFTHHVGARKNHKVNSLDGSPQKASLFQKVALGRKQSKGNVSEDVLLGEYQPPLGLQMEQKKDESEPTTEVPAKTDQMEGSTYMQVDFASESTVVAEVTKPVKTLCTKNLCSPTTSNNNDDVVEEETADEEKEEATKNKPDVKQEMDLYIPSLQAGEAKVMEHSMRRRRSSLSHSGQFADVAAASSLVGSRPKPSRRRSMDTSTETKIFAPGQTSMNVLSVEDSTSHHDKASSINAELKETTSKVSSRKSSKAETPAATDESKASSPTKPRLTRRKSFKKLKAPKNLMMDAPQAEAESSEDGPLKPKISRRRSIATSNTSLEIAGKNDLTRRKSLKKSSSSFNVEDGVGGSGSLRKPPTRIKSSKGGSKTSTEVCNDGDATEQKKGSRKKSKQIKIPASALGISEVAEALASAAAHQTVSAKTVDPTPVPTLGETGSQPIKVGRKLSATNFLGLRRNISGSSSFLRRNKAHICLDDDDEEEEV